jgi:HSP20 family protein
MLPVLRNSLMPPTAPVNRLISLFDRLFPEGPFNPPTTSSWDAPAAVWEDENCVYAEADLPGMTEKDVELSVHDGYLFIRGERKSEKKEGGYDSRWFGRFEQRIALPASVDPDAAEAKLTNGVLTVTLPKKAEARPHRIALKGG